MGGHKFTNDDIHEAAGFWSDDEEAAKPKYGDIAGWDVLLVTDMSQVNVGLSQFHLAQRAHAPMAQPCAACARAASHGESV